MEKKRKRKDITRNINWEELGEKVKKEGKSIEDFINTININREYIYSMSALRDIQTMSGVIKNPKDKICYFYPENKAWVGEDVDTGTIRYFSTNGGSYFYLDISDFYKLFYGTNLNKRLVQIFSDFNIKVKEEGFKMDQYLKYRDNLEKIEEGYVVFGEYPNLWKVVKKSLGILSRLNIIGQSNIKGISDTVMGESVFFSATRYVANPVDHGLSAISVSSVDRAINLLCLLGLVVKVRERDLPIHVYEKAKEEAARRKGVGTNNLTNMYICKALNNEVLEGAENKAREMREKGLTISKISYENILKSFGEEIAENIYGDNRESTIKAMNGKIVKEENRKLIKELDKMIPF